MFKRIVSAPLELFIYLLATLIFIVLYGQIVLVPTALLTLASLVLLYFISPAELTYIAALFALAGFITGVLWAEHIRRKYSIFGFHGYLSNNPEIDGYQRPSQGVVFRQGNLVKH
ncbi:hypothetical protein J7384_05210 [Endozoicomonas sp. G2_1]|uniref:hypothetical protein n=1 Tax=Endozoicomonas sp. G2_1 TaxID=2821091 RepID=UPI001ADD0997|nr:hypothetical protein [Endozoicomonas sp. G2_1]MBO9489760.1 hypothetical protein [Endozoicomonas sp. G2_1]